jgi:hypothetical protein
MCLCVSAPMENNDVFSAESILVATRNRPLSRHPYPTQRKHELTTRGLAEAIERDTLQAQQAWDAFSAKFTHLDDTNPDVFTPTREASANFEKIDTYIIQPSGGKCPHPSEGHLASTFNYKKMDLQNTTLIEWLMDKGVGFEHHQRGFKTGPRAKWGRDIKKHQAATRVLRAAGPLGELVMDPHPHEKGLLVTPHPGVVSSKDAAPPFTHCAIKGMLRPGRFNIGLNDENILALAWLSLYRPTDTRPIRKRRPNTPSNMATLAELGTNVKGIMIDFDLALPEHMGYIDIRKIHPNKWSILGVLQAAMCRCYPSSTPSHQFDLVVLTACGLVDKGSAKGKFAKTSYTLTWRHLPTNIEDHEAIRRYLLYSVRRAFGVDLCGEDWNKVLDPVVMGDVHANRCIFSDKTDRISKGSRCLLHDTDIPSSSAVDPCTVTATTTATKATPAPAPASTSAPVPTAGGISSVSSRRKQRKAPCTCLFVNHNRPAVFFCYVRPSGALLHTASWEQVVLGASVGTMLAPGTGLKVEIPAIIDDEDLDLRLPDVSHVHLGTSIACIEERKQMWQQRKGSLLSMDPTASAVHPRARVLQWEGGGGWSGVDSLSASSTSTPTSTSTTPSWKTRVVDWDTASSVSRASPLWMCTLGLLEKRMRNLKNPLALYDLDTLQIVDQHHLRGKFVSRACRCMVAEQRDNNSYVVHNSNQTFFTLTVSSRGDKIYVNTYDYHCTNSLPRIGDRSPSLVGIVFESEECTSTETNVLDVFRETIKTHYKD